MSEGRDGASDSPPRVNFYHNLSGMHILLPKFNDKEPDVFFFIVQECCQ